MASIKNILLLFAFMLTVSMAFPQGNGNGNNGNGNGNSGNNGNNGNHGNGNNGNHGNGNNGNGNGNNGNGNNGNGNGHNNDNNGDDHGLNITVPKVALVAIRGGNINLSFNAPSEAGSNMTTNSNSNLWLNYSSVTAVGATNSISVKISNTIPSVDLKVLASADAGQGQGVIGTASSILTLTTSDQTIVSGIGSGYTGNGTNKGHNLTYSLFSNTYSALNYTASPVSILVTYTITNN